MGSPLFSYIPPVVSHFFDCYYDSGGFSFRVADLTRSVTYMALSDGSRCVDGRTHTVHSHTATAISKIMPQTRIDNESKRLHTRNHVIASRLANRSQPISSQSRLPSLLPHGGASDDRRRLAGLALQRLCTYCPYCRGPRMSPLP